MARTFASEDFRFCVHVHTLPLAGRVAKRPFTDVSGVGGECLRSSFSPPTRFPPACAGVNHPPRKGEGKTHALSSAGFGSAFGKTFSRIGRSGRGQHAD
jgi:hypothetical protein